MSRCAIPEAVLIERAGTDGQDQTEARDQLVARVQGGLGQAVSDARLRLPALGVEEGHGDHAGAGVTDHRPAGRPDWVAIRALVPRRDVNGIMDELAAISQSDSGVGHQVLPILLWYPRCVSVRWGLIAHNARVRRDRDACPVLLLALLIGVVAGLRSLTAPAVVSGRFSAGSTCMEPGYPGWGNFVTVEMSAFLAVADSLTTNVPKHRRVPGRRCSLSGSFLGAFAGAVIGTAWGYRWGGLLALGLRARHHGAAIRHAEAAVARGGHDLPIAPLEDSVAGGLPSRRRGGP